MATFPAVQGRTQPFTLKFPLILESTTRIKGSHASFAPLDDRGSAGAAAAQAKTDAGDTVVTLRLTRDTGTYPAPEYDRLRTAVNRSLAVFETGARPDPASTPKP
jgi:hypothetical protein